MQLENKVFGKVCLVSPDNPSNTYIAQPKLVTTSSHNNLTMDTADNKTGTYDALMETTLGSLKSHSSFG